MEIRVHTERSAGTRLRDLLGVDVDVFERVLLRADAEAKNYTALDPPSLSGVNRWGRTVRALREELLALGWTYDNPRNLARTVSPDRSLAIIATLGDELTGNPEGVPSTKYTKGAATIDAVARNFVQLAFFGDEGDTSEADSESTITWVLLYHVAEREIRAELSLPEAPAKGRLEAWSERILLPPVPLETTTQVASSSAPDIDVTVTRRHRTS